jgi:hypothetical protein
LVLDGRLRHTPSELRPFSLFYAITRVEPDADNKEVFNMTWQYIKSTTTITVGAMPGKPAAAESIATVQQFRCHVVKHNDV